MCQVRPSTAYLSNFVVSLYQSGGSRSHLVCFCRLGAAWSACCAQWLLPGSRSTHLPHFLHSSQYNTRPWAKSTGFPSAFSPATKMRWAAGPRPGCRAAGTVPGASCRRPGTSRCPRALRAPQRSAASGPRPSPGTSWCRGVRRAPHHRALAVTLSSRKRRRRASLRWQSA